MRADVQGTSYIFDASAKTVQLGFTIEQERLLSIVNATRTVTIYDPTVSGRGGTCAGDTITLTYDTTSHADTDKLVIIYAEYDEDTAPVLVNAAKESGGNLAAIAAVDFATGAKQDTQTGYLDGIRDDTTELLTRVPDLGTAVMIGSTPVTIATNDTQTEAIKTKLDDLLNNTSGANTALNDILIELGQKFETSDISTLVEQIHPVVNSVWRANSNGTGYTSGDFLMEIYVITSINGAVDTRTWWNVTTGAAIATPTLSHLSTVDNSVLQSIKTAVEIMDDWDESDRAKVNPIVGQAGVSAGTGVIDGGTQRVTIADDDALIVAINAAVYAIATSVYLSRDTKELTNANVSFSSSGENTVVSGTASQTIRVFRGSFTAASAVTLTVKDAAGGNTLATIPLSAGGTFSFDTAGSGEPLWVTATSGAFVISLSSAVSVQGFIQYTKS